MVAAPHLHFHHGDGADDWSQVNTDQAFTGEIDLSSAVFQMPAGEASG